MINPLNYNLFSTDYFTFYFSFFTFAVVIIQSGWAVNLGTEKLGGFGLIGKQCKKEHLYLFQVPKTSIIVFVNSSWVVGLGYYGGLCRFQTGVLGLD